MTVKFVVNNKVHTATKVRKQEEIEKRWKIKLNPKMEKFRRSVLSSRMVDSVFLYYLFHFLFFYF